ncbi:MAG: methylmalonyl-CoA epimerase [Acidobacteria bacterium]|nr:methylmalonyl-CoA epimerase [Acidobacteriota bacterium]
MILGVDHLGIAVRSIAEGRAFYEALGLAVAAIEEVPGDLVRVAMIPCGAMRLELLEPTSPESPIARFLERRGPGLHHLCLASDDLAADDALLRGAGYQVLRPRHTRGAGGCWIQFVHPKSAGGVLIELSQAAPAVPAIASAPAAAPAPGPAGRGIAEAAGAAGGVRPQEKP